MKERFKKRGGRGEKLSQEFRNVNATDKGTQTDSGGAVVSCLLLWNEEKLGKDKQAKGTGCLGGRRQSILGSKRQEIK